MSSGSRSGNSSSTCSLVRPAASRSKTSVTRMRIPRMQGGPPHCSGLMVIRLRNAAAPLLTLLFYAMGSLIAVAVVPVGTWFTAQQPPGLGAAPGRRACQGWVSSGGRTMSRYSRLLSSSSTPHLLVWATLARCWGYRYGELEYSYCPPGLQQVGHRVFLVLLGRVRTV